MPKPQPEPVDFAEVGRVPAPGDNVAIAVRTLTAGTRILIRQLVFELSHTVLEGHRFAIFRIRKGEALLSWGLPFGVAALDIEPGEYVCNEKILRVLPERHVDFKLPASANFIDHHLPYELDTAHFQPGRQVRAPAPHPTFEGFRRNERRGVGTRNYVVIIGVNSRTGTFARKLASHFSAVREQFASIDGVVPVAHTEGGGVSRPNNFDLTLRTLAGFMVNPNVGAVLCVDHGGEILSNNALREYLAVQNYPVDRLIHEFISIGDSFEHSMARGREIISGWLGQVHQFRREAIPISHLRVALQCGGSDAFSGISGNPLAGILSRETVAHGGSANLAETDELIGAERYVLSNVRDMATAKAFLEKVRRFEQWAGVHGHTAEGNPSGGNNFRGLYNIAIKAIGAARKRDPATRLDFVIDYAEPMTERGFYFMDSPGNDLESIAGQVASGCNLILFVTGNGSITNFPFVPAIKIMTTTSRFELVREEMDINAGRYQDGESLEDLGREAFGYMIRVASGERSAGEKAGHSQVQLWREWRSNIRPLVSSGGSSQAKEAPLGSLQEHLSKDHLELARQITSATSAPRVALVLPTSLCAGQISVLMAEKLNRLAGSRFDRAVALPHTEGCGNSGGESERLFMRTMAGYLAHPFVARALLLEHGCEKTHNDAFGNLLRELGAPESQYGFASIQLDGGIERVTAKCLKWFQEQEAGRRSVENFTLGIHGHNLPDVLVHSFTLLEWALLAAGAAIVFSKSAENGIPNGATTQRLEYGERLEGKGSFVMECPTDDDIEIITGLGAVGAQMLLVYVPEAPVPSNPLIPTLQIGRRGSHADILLQASVDPKELAASILRLMLDVRLGRHLPAGERDGNAAFQITRGYEGISL